MTTGRRIAVPIIALVMIAAPLAISSTVPMVRAGTPGIASDDFYTTLEDKPLTVAAPGVLANDTPSYSCVLDTDTFELTGSLGAGVASNGSFTFTPAKNFNGSTRFAYGMAPTDSVCPYGPFSPGDTGEVFITVTPVNDPPRVVLGPDCKATITVGQDSSQFTARHCVEMEDFGPIDENNQSFDAWLVSTNHPELFSGKPSVARIDGLFGRLRFTPADGASGTATISIRGRDSGGTQNKGKNTSAALTVKVVITAAPTAAPTVAPTPEPTIEPTPEPTEPTPTATMQPVEPTETAGPSPEPSDSASPSGSTGPSGIAVVLGGLLILLMGAFVAAVAYPRWRATRG